MTANGEALSTFIDSAPPGELSNVVTAIKNIAAGGEKVVGSIKPAIEKYDEEQFTAVALPGKNKEVIVSSFNSLGEGRYYDIESQSSFEFDHITQKASSVQSYTVETAHNDLLTSLLNLFTGHANEHYPSNSTGVFSIENDTTIAILSVANKYSPGNFWNGRWRSQYFYKPSDGTLNGNVKIDVHYYEDGNVRMQTDKALSAFLSSSAAAAEIVKKIAAFEKQYQEDLNGAFTTLSEGAFKSLRRQLPITRQKVEWEKISGYRLGQDLTGGKTS